MSSDSSSKKQPRFCALGGEGGFTSVRKFKRAIFHEGEGNRMSLAGNNKYALLLSDRGSRKDDSGSVWFEAKSCQRSILCQSLGFLLQNEPLLLIRRRRKSKEVGHEVAFHTGFSLSS